MLLLFLLSIKGFFVYGPLMAPQEAVIKPIGKDDSHISISKRIYLLLVEYRYDLTSILIFLEYLGFDFNWPFLGLIRVPPGSIFETISTDD